jgi:hypothetical protein
MIAHYQSGGSDKVYVVRYSKNFNGEWIVEVFFGRRLRGLQHQIKATLPSDTMALGKCLEIFHEKLVRGYVDIESPNYTGNAREIKGWLKRSHVLADSVRIVGIKGETPKELEPKEPDDPDEKQLAAPPESMPEGDFEVTCKDSFGLEDKFDEGVDYLAESHLDKTMLYVYDRAGLKRECFARRFVRKESAT